MYDIDQRRAAIELFIQYDHSYAQVIRELGYPNRHTLCNWWKDYEATGGVREGCKHRSGKFADGQKKAAVDHYLQHGKSASRAVRKLGYPSRQTLVNWVEQLAPGERKIGSKRASYDITLEEKAEAVIALESRKGSARQVANEWASPGRSSTVGGTSFWKARRVT